MRAPLPFAVVVGLVLACGGNPTTGRADAPAADGGGAKRDGTAGRGGSGQGGAGSGPGGGAGSGGGCPAGGYCRPGQDLTCNADGSTATRYGICRPDCSCQCLPDYERDPDSYACRPRGGAGGGGAGVSAR